MPHYYILAYATSPVTHLQYYTLLSSTMEDSSDLSIYSTIRIEDKKGKTFGDAAFKSNSYKLSSNHVRTCVRSLLKSEILKNAFDPLLRVPGLRQGMRFTTIHKLCSAKTDEVGITDHSRHSLIALMAQLNNTKH